MNINHLTDKLETISLGYADKFDVERTADWFILKLTEEFGELVQSYLQYSGQATLAP